MGDFYRMNNGEYPLHYEEEFYDEFDEDCYDDEFDEDYYDDPSEFIPRIKGTELETGIAFLGSNYFPLLTSRVNDGKRKYYLFDFIKIWQTDDDTRTFEYDEDGYPYYE